MHDDRKKSLFKLKTILESNIGFQGVYPFLNSEEALFLPKNTKELLSQISADLTELERNGPYGLPPEMPDEEIQRRVEEEHKFHESLSEKERYSLESDEMIYYSRERLKSNIKENLTELNE